MDFLKEISSQTFVAPPRRDGALLPGEASPFPTPCNVGEHVYFPGFTARPTRLGGGCSTSLMYGAAPVLFVFFGPPKDRPLGEALAPPLRFRLGTARPTRLGGGCATSLMYGAAPILFGFFAPPKIAPFGESVSPPSAVQVGGLGGSVSPPPVCMGEVYF